MSPSFSRTSTEEHDTIVYATIEPLVNELVAGVRKGETVALYPAMRKFALKSIIAFCYGKSSISAELINNTAISKIFQVLDAAPKELQHFPVIRKSLGFLSTMFPQLLPEAIMFLQRYGMKHLHASRESSDTSHPGLFKRMQERLKLKGQSLTDDQLIAESSTMFFAGTDTTATTVSVGLWHLMHQPDAYARLQDELKTVMPEC
ncbi:cytochrome P450 [Aspergillus floccosus]